MPSTVETKSIVTTKIKVRPDTVNGFADWQAKLNAQIAAFPGFISLEILSPNESSPAEWTIVQRFNDSESLSVWRESKEHHALMKELEDSFAEKGSNPIVEVETEASNLRCVTEVIVTQVSSDKEKSFREWMSKVHKIEAKFPGFRGVYVQSPSQGKHNWITLLQFDTPENLDRWLISSERQEVLHESQSFIDSVETHRVISGYPGWFSSLAKEGIVPPVWKQTMVVLLVLFPIVMLQLRYLSLLTSDLNRSLATFISNAISVSLIAWPMMPIAIWFLGWWLSPKEEKRQKATIIGTLILILLYLVEIAIFWNLF